MTLYDSIKKSYAILNNEGYLYGRNIESLVLLDTGRWIDNSPKQFLIDNNAAEECEFSEDKIGTILIFNIINKLN